MPTYDTNFGAKRAREARERLGLDEASPVACVLTLVEAAGMPVIVGRMPDDVAGRAAGTAGTGRSCGSTRRSPWSGSASRSRTSSGTSAAATPDTAVDTTATISGRTHDPREVQANAFAAELLAPRAGVRGDDRRATPASRTSCGSRRTSAISTIAALYRCSTLGLVSTRRYEQLQREIAEELHREVWDYLAARDGPRRAVAASRTTRGCPTRWRARRSPRCCAARSASTPPPTRPGCAADRLGGRGRRLRPLGVRAAEEQPVELVHRRGRRRHRGLRERLEIVLEAASPPRASARNIACPGAAASRRPPARARSAPGHAERCADEVEQPPRHARGVELAALHPLEVVLGALLLAREPERRRHAARRGRGLAQARALAQPRKQLGPRARAGPRSPPIAPAKAGSALIAASASAP